MATEVVMPRLGWTMEEGILVEWLKHDGDQVEVGDILFTVESDKALNEIESFDSGILRIPPNSPPPGKPVPVGTLLAYLVALGEKAPFEEQTGEHVQAQPLVQVGHGDRAVLHEPASFTQQTTESAPSSVARLDDRNQKPAISPRARRVANELGIEWRDLAGSGRIGRIVERDVRAAAAQGRKPDMRISPVARRLAAELDVDLERLAASMPGKRIERADVESAAKAAAEPSYGVAGKSLPISRMRRIIADRMAASAHTTAPVTLTTEVDATELIRLRTELKNDPVTATRPVPTYTDLLVKLSAQALVEHPFLNARIEGDRIILPDVVNVGIAVDTERGLLVPVLQDVTSKPLRQLARERAALVERVRNHQLGADELRGSTFTITNLGMYEIDAFTPIINLPECAILGVGRIVAKQIVVDASSERVAIRQMMFLSLTFDHRLVDGVPAAQFLQRVKQFIERPFLWLIE